LGTQARRSGEEAIADESRADEPSGRSVDELTDGLMGLIQSLGREPVTNGPATGEPAVGEPAVGLSSRVQEPQPHTFGSLVGLTHIAPVGCWCRIHDPGEWRMHDAGLEIGGSFRAPA
jgi:hypothetical protein